MPHRLPQLAAAIAAAGSCSVLAPAALPTAADAAYLGAIGAPGIAAGPAELANPWGVAVSPDGRVYVADGGTHRVSVFDSAGAPVRQFGSVAQPTGIVVNGGQVLVPDRATSTVRRWTSTGSPMPDFGGGPGTAPGQFQQPAGIGLGKVVSGDVHEVLVTSKQRFTGFSATGTSPAVRFATASGAASFAGIAGIAGGRDGTIYTGDTVGDVIERFDPTLGYLGGTAGAIAPTGLAFDEPDNVLWIADRIKGVSRMSSGGVALGALDTGSDPAAKLFDPTGVAVDCRGTVYVADQLAGHVQKYGPRSAPVAGNLLRNGTFDEGGGSCSTVRIAGAGPGWSADAAATTTHYGATGGFPARSDGDFVDGGESFLAGGVAAVTTVEQVVDVSASALDIDAGRRRATLSGVLGGVGAADDRATVDAIALGAGGQALATLTLGPVTQAQRGSVTRLLPRTATATVPAGTRSIRVRITMRRAAPTGYDRAAVDDLALVLTPQDPPAGPASGAPSGAGGSSAGGSGAATGTSGTGASRSTRARVTLRLVRPATALRTRSLAVRVGCDRACTVTLRARRVGSGTTLATRRVTLRAPGTRTVLLRLTRDQAATLTRLAHPRLRVTASGGRATVTRAAQVRR